MGASVEFDIVRGIDWDSGESKLVPASLNPTWWVCTIYFVLYAPISWEMGHDLLPPPSFTVSAMVGR